MIGKVQAHIQYVDILIHAVIWVYLLLRYCQHFVSLFVSF